MAAVDGGVDCFICLEPCLPRRVCACTSLHMHPSCQLMLLRDRGNATCAVCRAPYRNVLRKGRLHLTATGRAALAWSTAFVSVCLVCATVMVSEGEAYVAALIVSYGFFLTVVALALFQHRGGSLSSVSYDFSLTEAEDPPPAPPGSSSSSSEESSDFGSGLQQRSQ